MSTNEEIDEKLLRIGAKVVDELLLHETPIETHLKINVVFSDIYTIFVDAHSVCGFVKEDLGKIRYRAQRANLPPEGQKQLDKLEEML